MKIFKLVSKIMQAQKCAIMIHCDWQSNLQELNNRPRKQPNIWLKSIPIQPTPTMNSADQIIVTFSCAGTSNNHLFSSSFCCNSPLLFIVEHAISLLYCYQFYLQVQHSCYVCLHLLCCLIRCVLNILNLNLLL